MSKKKKPKVNSIGFIVEDESDYESFKVLTKRITNCTRLKFRRAVGKGCGKMRRKALSYSQTLAKKGCEMVILVHDLDRNNLKELLAELKRIIACSPAKFNFICIPIEELEGWFLADPENIKNVFSLSSIPKIKGLPETLNSPKERIEGLVKLHSNGSKIYLNTKHNETLCNSISIAALESRCPSFKAFHDYLTEFRYG